jgi:hypothetical protein
MEDEENTFGIPQNVWDASVVCKPLPPDAFRSLGGVETFDASSVANARLRDQWAAVRFFRSLKTYHGRDIRGIVVRISATDSSFQRYLVHSAKEVVLATVRFGDKLPVRLVDSANQLKQCTQRY